MCATLAGICAVVCGSPVDVMKTRIMNAPTGMYRNPIHAFIKTFSEEGITAFYKGFGPNCGRLAGWNIIMFLTLE